MVVDGNVTNRIPLLMSKYLQLNSASYKIHYFEEGNGETILCLHGNPTWSYYFRDIAKQLKHKFRVIAYDHIGSGFSSRPDDFKYRLQDHIDILDEFIKLKKLKRFHLLVHDWGGAIGLGWLKDNIDKVDKLIVTNSAAFYSADVPKRIALLKIPVLGRLLIQNLNLFALASTFMGSSKGLSKDSKDLLLLPTKHYKDRIGIAKFVEDIPLTDGHPSYNTLKQIELSLPKIKVPILLMWGMKDFCFHKGFLDTWLSFFGHAKVNTYKDAGHFLLDDVKEKFCSDLCRFLRSA